jgi:hypothetical protein
MILSLTKKKLFIFTGYPYGVTLGSSVGSVFTGGAAECYGFWMHTVPDGRSEYFVLDWLAT